ncbi:hypothetical protein PMIN04_002624 [Paraphaeosphaeria minitans]
MPSTSESRELLNILVLALKEVLENLEKNEDKLKTTPCKTMLRKLGFGPPKYDGLTAQILRPIRELNLPYDAIKDNMIQYCELIKSKSEVIGSDVNGQDNFISALWSCKTWAPIPRSMSSTGAAQPPSYPVASQQVPQSDDTATMATNNGSNEPDQAEEDKDEVKDPVLDKLSNAQQSNLQQVLCPPLRKVFDNLSSHRAKGAHMHEYAEQILNHLDTRTSNCRTEGAAMAWGLQTESIDSFDIILKNIEEFCTRIVELTQPHVLSNDGGKSFAESWSWFSKIERTDRKKLPPRTRRAQPDNAAATSSASSSAISSRNAVAASSGPPSGMQAGNGVATLSGTQSRNVIASLPASSSGTQTRTSTAISSSSDSQLDLQEIFSQLIDRLKEDVVLGEDLKPELANPKLAKDLADHYTTTTSLDSLNLFQNYLSEIDRFKSRSDGRKLCEAVLRVLIHWNEHSPDMIGVSIFEIYDIVDQYTTEVRRDEFDDTFEFQVVLLDSDTSLPFSEYFRQWKRDAKKATGSSAPSNSLAPVLTPNANTSTVANQPTASAPLLGTSASNARSIQSHAPTTGLVIPGQPSYNNSLSQKATNTPTVAAEPLTQPTQPTTSTLTGGSSTVGANNTSAQKSPSTPQPSAQGVTDGKAFGSNGSAYPYQVAPNQLNTTTPIVDVIMEDPEAPAADPEEESDPMEGVESPGSIAAALVSESQGAAFGNGSMPPVQAASEDEDEDMTEDPVEPTDSDLWDGVEAMTGLDDDEIIEDAPALKSVYSPSIAMTASRLHGKYKIEKPSAVRHRNRRWKDNQKGLELRVLNLRLSSSNSQAQIGGNQPQAGAFHQPHPFAAPQSQAVTTPQSETVIAPQPQTVASDQKSPSTDGSNQSGVSVVPTSAMTLKGISKVNDDTSHESPVDQLSSIPTELALPLKTSDRQDIDGRSEEPVSDVLMEAATESGNSDASNVVMEQESSASAQVDAQPAASHSQVLPQTGGTASQALDSSGPLQPRGWSETTTYHFPRPRIPTPQQGSLSAAAGSSRSSRTGNTVPPVTVPPQAGIQTPEDARPEVPVSATQTSISVQQEAEKTVEEDRAETLTTAVESVPAQQQEQAHTTEDIDVTVASQYANSEESSHKSGQGTTTATRADPLINIVGNTSEGLELPQFYAYPNKWQWFLRLLLEFLFAAFFTNTWIGLGFIHDVGLQGLQLFHDNILLPFGAGMWNWCLIPAGKAVQEYGPTVVDHAQGVVSEIASTLCKTVAAGWNLFRSALASDPAIPTTPSPATRDVSPSSAGPTEYGWLPSVPSVQQPSFGARLQYFNGPSSVPVHQQPSSAARLQSQQLLGSLRITALPKDQYTCRMRDCYGGQFYQTFYGQEAREKRALFERNWTPCIDRELWNTSKEAPRPNFA